MAQWPRFALPFCCFSEAIDEPLRSLASTRTIERTQHSDLHLFSVRVKPLFQPVAFHVFTIFTFVNFNEFSFTFFYSKMNKKNSRSQMQLHNAAFCTDACFSVLQQKAKMADKDSMKCQIPVCVEWMRSMPNSILPMKRNQILNSR